jgi:BarA-like signal transduction histidine kinase
VDESVAECTIAVDNTGGLHVMYRKRWGEPEQHSIMYMNNLGSGWSSPVAVITESAPLDGLSPIGIDVDADGNWHAVYHLDYLSGDNEIMYLSSTSGTPVILAQSTVDESVAECTIAVDNTGGLHVMYRKRWGEPEQHLIMYMNTLGT